MSPHRAHSSQERPGDRVPSDRWGGARGSTLKRRCSQSDEWMGRHAGSRGDGFCGHSMEHLVSKRQEIQRSHMACCKGTGQGSWALGLRGARRSICPICQDVCAHRTVLGTQL